MNYYKFHNCNLLKFQRFLCTSSNNDMKSIQKIWIQNYTKLNYNEKINIINTTIIPFINSINTNKSDTLNKLFSRTKGSIETILQLRLDIMKPSNELNHKDLKNLDIYLKSYLLNIYNIDHLFLKQITYQSSSKSTLECILNGDSVHKSKSIEELKEKLENGLKHNTYNL